MPAVPLVSYLDFRSVRGYDPSILYQETWFHSERGPQMTLQFVSVLPKVVLHNTYNTNLFSY